VGLSELGYGFGVYTLVGQPPWRLWRTDRGGSVRVSTDRAQTRGQHVRDCERGPLLWRGNAFLNFTHPRDMQGREYWYWDNPLLPQFSGPSRACTEPRKFYNRLVYRGLFPDRLPVLTEACEQRINANLRQTGTVSRWQDCFEPRDCDLSGDTVVLALPTQQCLTHYYRVTEHRLIETVQRVCASKALRLRIRRKPTPQEKYHRSRAEWQYRRRPEDLCVVGVHSAIGMEVLEQGVPYVALGGHGCGGLATTWQEFVENRVRAHTVTEFMQWCSQLITQTWLRADLTEGAWSVRSWHEDSAQPFRQLETEFHAGQ